MKIAIFHDYFDKRGGGERLVLNLAKALKADVYTGFIEHKKTFDPHGVKIIDLKVSKNLPKLLLNVAIAKKFESYNFPKYSAYIFSGVWCISAAKRCHPNVLYCHTPPRFMYDLKYYFLEKSSFIEKFVLKKFIKYWKIKDQFYMHQFDFIGTNSENVRKRILKYYGHGLYKRSMAVYTGIHTEKFHFKKDEGFYLSTSRLDELKRINLIIEAFKEMPFKRLVIAGKGPEERRLKRLARGCSNIKFAGSVSEERMSELYSRCKGVIVCSIDEDLGLSAIEAQASGKSCIAVKEGGFLETVEEGKTGVFFRPDKESLIDAIHKSEKVKWNYRLIQKKAKRFDIKRFVKTMKKAVTKAKKYHKNKRRSRPKR